MSNLPVRAALGQPGSFSPERRASREISKARAYGQAVAAQEEARVEAIAQITESALLATAHVSAMESLLITQAPHAEQRLRHLADAGCAGMAAVVLGASRKV